MSTWDDPTTGAPPPGGVAPRDPDLAAVTDDDEEDGELVRPFVITGGRTRHASVHLRVETLVVATGNAHDRQLQFEHARIIGMCNSPISVAERTRVSSASRANASPMPSIRPSMMPSVTAR